MITLSIIGIIWGIISYFKIKKECDQKDIEFNPLEVDNVLYNVVYFLGFVIGLGVLVTLALYVCIKYLP